MRLFVAIRFNSEVNKALLSVMHDLKKRGVTGNYVPGSNLHMTLAFIGETDRVDDVKNALASITVPEIRISLSEAGTFGNVLWIGAKGNQKLKGCVKDVRDALDRAGIPYDKEKFVPHITIVRKAGGNLKDIKVPKAEMMVEGISLMKSETKNGAVVYKELKKF